MDLKGIRAIGVRYKARKRIGRGTATGQGTTAGKGSKGQKSRSGSMPRRTFEGGQMPLARRLPKRGFSNEPFKKVFTVVNVSELDRFDDGTNVDPGLLQKSGLAKAPRDGIKILGEGELTKKLVVRAHRFSESAKQKITAAGGEVVELGVPVRGPGPKIAKSKPKPKPKPKAPAPAKAPAKAPATEASQE